MKKLLFLMAMLWGVAYGQSTIYLRGDTVKIQKSGGNGEIVIQNSTRDTVGGFLYNTGGGRTIFKTPASLGILPGGSQTWQQTIDAGSTLDKNNTIAQAGFKFTFGGEGSVVVGSSAFTNTSVAKIQARAAPRQPIASFGNLAVDGIPIWFGTDDTTTTANLSSQTVRFLQMNRNLLIQDNGLTITDKSGSLFSLNVKSKDSVYHYTVGGDLQYALSAHYTLGKFPGFSGRTVHQGGQIAFDAVPSIKGYLGFSGTTSSVNNIRARGYWAGVTSFINIGNVNDSIDHWNGFIAGGYNPVAYIKSFTGLYVGSVRTDSGWSLYSTSPNYRMFQPGPASFGSTTNTGPVEALELTGNFKHYALASSNNAADSMVVWNPTSQLYGKRPIPSGGGGGGTIGGSIANAQVAVGSGTDVIAGSSALRFVAPTLTIGDAGVGTGGIEFNGTTSGTVTVKAADAAGTHTITLPTTAGTATYLVTSSGGSGPWTYTDPATLGGGVSQSVITDTLQNYWRKSGNNVTSGTHFIGSINNVSLRFRTNNTQVGYWDSTGRFIVGQPGIFTAADGGTALICIKQSGNGFAGGIAMYNNANDATTMSYTVGGIYSNQTFGLTALGANIFYNSAHNKFGDNGTGTAKVHIAAGTATAGTAPLKFTSGTLLTTAEAGAAEFLTDKFYGTITTSAARKEFTLNDAALTSGTTPVATTNGRLTDGLVLARGTYTPTASSVTGGTVTGFETWNYYRVGDMVTISGYVAIDPTADEANISFNIDLPIASNFTDEFQGSGTASYLLKGSTFWMEADATNNNMRITFNGGTGSTVGLGVRIIASYRIL